MTLAPATRLGPYEIVALVGAGGMGEVYRARDTTLGRTVAIKVVSTGLVRDSFGEGRLEREARALAALNHPHIATLYAVEPFGDTRALVMEFVEGDTLADRLAPGPLPVTEALTIGRQIAEALEAAHAKGIIHRDLKPANVKLTPSGHVKVLDFGLAKAAGAIQDQLTTVADATREGVVVGTAQYMSPQQARGQSVERDADIWAFGCVLYEMLTGRRAFSGATMSDTIANVLQGEPDWSAVPQSVPAEAVRLMRRCLTKDPARRLRDIADARLEIEDWLSSGSTSAAIPASLAASSTGRSARSLIGASAAALCLGGAIGLLAPRILGRTTATTPSAPMASVFGMSQPSDESLYLFANPVVVSPDGSHIALVTNGPEGRP
ncbi:MAG TPA: serine/threonine-protein kinase, partial [Vicinamibacterales bacterium]